MLLQAVHLRNEAQKHVLFAKIVARFGPDLSGCPSVSGGWRSSPAPTTCARRRHWCFWKRCSVPGRGCWPMIRAMDSARSELPRAWFESGRLFLARHQYEALDGVDALVLSLSGSRSAIRIFGP